MKLTGAAILVLRDTKPLQAAGQASSVVRLPKVLMRCIGAGDCRLLPFVL